MFGFELVPLKNLLKCSTFVFGPNISLSKIDLQIHGCSEINGFISLPRALTV